MKIAYLFLTVGDLNLPKVWSNFFKDENASSYKIYSHSKNSHKINSNSPLFNTQIKNSVNTKWGDSSIVKATLFLLAQALIDNNDMYILLSESTVPFKDHSYIQSYLENGENRIAPIECVHDHKNLYKSSQWFILNKSTVKKLLSVTEEYISDPDLTSSTHLGAPDELYFATILRRLQIPVVEEMTTYYKFTGVDYEETKEKLNQIYDQFKKIRNKMTNSQIKQFKDKHRQIWGRLKDEGKHPITFSTISEDDLKIFTRPNLLFGRKFSANSNIGDYLCHDNNFTGITVTPNHHPYLVIVPTGSDTVQRNFLDREKRCFDLAIVHYGDSTEDEQLFKEQSNYFIKAKGPKWKLIAKALREIPYQQYQLVWMPDDDLEISVTDLNSLFRIVAEKKLQLSQPSLKIPGYDPKELQKVLSLTGKPIDQITLTDLYELRKVEPTYAKTINAIIYRISWYHLLKQGNSVRPTHFVEVQAPMMTPAVINQLWRYINSSIVQAGFGLDDIWNKLIDKKWIVDQISIEHTRDIGYLKYQKYEKGRLNKSDLPNHFKSINKSPDQERTQMLQHFGFVKPYLLIVPTGDNTCFDFSKDRNKQLFDVCIIYYGKSPEYEKKFRDQSKYFFKLRGPKWSLIKQVLEQLHDWKLYKYIWIPDDDLIISTAKINEMYQVAEENKLQLSQPAVSIPGLPWKEAQRVLQLAPKDKLYDHSYLYDLRKEYPEEERVINKILYRVSYPQFIRQSESQIIRSSDHIEIQMPLFSKETLDQLYHIITDKMVQTGFGLDIIWNEKIKDKKVIDYIEVEHTRDIGLMKVQKYKKGKLEFEELPEQYKYSKDNPKVEQNKMVKKYL